MSICPHSKQILTPRIQALAATIGMDKSDLINIRNINAIPEWFTTESSMVAFIDRPTHERSPLHWGQLKLFMSELAFIQMIKDDTNVIIYAGAAPGDHIAYLAGLFPHIRFILYDPSPFCNELLRNPPKNVDVRPGYFTHETALALVHEFPKFAFMSDIRTRDGVASSLSGGSFEPPTEEYVASDMDMQAEWIKLMTNNISMAMLKFRLPWGKGTTTYFDGKILIPTFAPLTSTEARLIITPPFNEKEYDNEMYEQMCCYHNSIGRALMWDLEQYPIPGLDNCYDCAMLIKLASQQVNGTQQLITDFIQKTIHAIGNGKRNLATNYSKSTTRLYKR